MSKQKKTLAQQLREFRKAHSTVDDNDKVSPMTYEAIGANAPVAMMTLYRIETGKAQPMPATTTVVRQFMAAYKSCAQAERCVRCDKARAKRRAS